MATRENKECRFRVRSGGGTEEQIEEQGLNAGHFRAVFMDNN